MNTSRRAFIAGAGATLAMTGYTQQLCRLAKDRKLNILFIMTDDHAAHAISAYGSKVNKTPGIDRIAKEGMIFSSVMCTNPICTPSRAVIYSGRYSHKNGVPVFNDISKDLETVGGYMRKAGYYTAFVGKWHCGGPATIRDADWDKWLAYQNQGQYFDPWFWERKEDGSVGQLKFPGEYATENITKVCKGLIDKSLDTGKPFFMMMHHKAPHRNWLPSPKYKKMFRSMTLRDIPLPNTIFDDYEGRTSSIKTTAMTLLHHMNPGFDLKLAEYFSEGGKFETIDGKKFDGKKNEKGEYINKFPDGMTDKEKIQLSYLRYMQDYLACVQSVDDSVMEMQDYLKEKGLEENTLVIYTADQGFFLGDHGLYDKRFIMEETLKMPFLAKCPAFIAPGSVNNDIIGNVDFAPTFLDVAGAEKPECMQGDSFFKNMKGETPESWREALYCRYYIEGGEHGTSAWYGIRTKTDKLVYYYKRNEWEYFDMVRDPEEVHNGYNDTVNQERIAYLKTVIQDLRVKYEDTEDEYQNSGEYWAVKNKKEEAK